LFGLLAGVAGYNALRFAAPFVRSAFAGKFQFEDMASPAGFRQLTREGASSVGFNPLIGLEPAQDTGMQALIRRTETEICSALFGPAQLSAGTVPIASFSDYNCPYCRLLTPRLAKLEANPDAAVRVTWHELPLLGGYSVLAAKAALAADRQGAYVALHKRLMRAAFLKTPAYIQRLAKDLEIDGDRLAVDMESAGVLAQIRRSIALSQIFGFIGTPALVVGNTVVQGQIDAPTLDRLIERERADGPVRACQST